MLDLVLGGGWAVGRVVNLVGDKAAGKTLLAVEACANFEPEVNALEDIRYIEAESAYDEAYGREIGMPEGIEPVDTITTVEQMFDDLSDFIRPRLRYPTPSLYVVDSLDALSDTAEMGRGIDKESFGTSKARKMSETFRRLVTDVSKANCTLFVVSQIRDKIGVQFGETKTRSGGRALDFYASQIVWLSELKKVTQTVNKVPRAIGTHIRCRNRKNKVGKPFRQTDMTVLFNYGVDDEVSMLDWLEDGGGTPAFVKDMRKELTQARKETSREWVQGINQLLREETTKRWLEIEAAVAPKMRKYA
jgi:recombination protein RecA